MAHVLYTLWLFGCMWYWFLRWNESIGNAWIVAIISVVGFWITASLPLWLFGYGG